MMGRWLVRLKNENVEKTHATKPTKPPQGEYEAGFVGFVAYPATCFQKVGVGESMTVKPGAPALNDRDTPDAAPATDPERWCWPHSQAMNTYEVHTFTARVSRFTAKGLLPAQAEVLADQLVIRDREGDDRRVCLECSNLQGNGRWRCGNWGEPEVARDVLTHDLALMAQRCEDFKVSS
jgi:hypothetical protein